MRTTIDINDEILREAKRAAADQSTSVRAIIETALRTYLGQRGQRRSYKLNWETEKGRIQPGVQLDDRDSLIDLMDGRG